MKRKQKTEEQKRKDAIWRRISRGGFVMGCYCGSGEAGVASELHDATCKLRVEVR